MERGKFPGQPEDLLPLEDFPEIEERFNPKQRRAFGSIPGLIGKELDIPPFHRLEPLALERVQAKTLEQGLFGVSGGNAVNGLVLSAEEYEAIVRHAPSFQSSIQAKIQAANRTTGDIRAKEKELRGVQSSLQNKTHRHNTVLQGLAGEELRLTKLAEWQRAPGYQKTNETEMRVLASDAWNGSFRHILQVLTDQHDLTPDEHNHMSNAMAHRLFRGPQRDRMEYWGQLLGVNLKYNRARRLLFENRARIIELETECTETKLTNFYKLHGISPHRK